MAGFKKILIAVDFSDIADKACECATALARQMNASLHMVHTVHIHAANIPEGGVIHIEEMQRQEEEEARTRLEEYMQSHSEGIDATMSICSGDPAIAINDTADEVGADLIVMGTHGRSGVARLLMGSVAESVLKKSSIPVLCVKA